MRSLKDILKNTEFGSKYAKYEFQNFGLRLAKELNDTSHKSLYIKLAKEEKRILLEEALDFVKESRAKSKPKLFMWKIKQLRIEDGSRKTDLPAGG